MRFIRFVQRQKSQTLNSVSVEDMPSQFLAVATDKKITIFTSAFTDSKIAGEIVHRRKNIQVRTPDVNEQSRLARRPLIDLKLLVIRRRLSGQDPRSIICHYANGSTKSRDGAP
jgi:hypothetical protein